MPVYVPTYIKITYVNTTEKLHINFLEQPHCNRYVETKRFDEDFSNVNVGHISIQNLAFGRDLIRHELRCQ